MIRQANPGADVILGTVLPDVGVRPQVENAWFANHDLSEGHPHVHGANFGIRAITYLRLGAWRPVGTGEDTDLADGPRCALGCRSFEPQPHTIRRRRQPGRRRATTAG